MLCERIDEGVSLPWTRKSWIKWELLRLGKRPLHR
jgi:hypothetical protein